MLDISHIEIEESVDGETYTEITDKSVLDQLTGLKAFIGKSGMIKPIWIKLLNGETDELTVTRGSLSTSDGTTFLIKILLAGFILTLSVEFTQMVNEDEDPIDDWYIDSGDAKYILTSEAQEIGAISELPVFENIVDKDGHKRFIEGDISLASSIEGVTLEYSKWSLSGSHLMLVLAGKIDNGATINGTMTNAIQLPAWVIEKIKPTYGSIVLRQNVTAYAGDGGTTQTILSVVAKSSGNIVIAGYGFTATDDRYFRMQFDLVVDNEETETPAP